MAFYESTYFSTRHHELTARIFGNHENNEYLCNSEIKQ